MRSAVVGYLNRTLAFLFPWFTTNLNRKLRVYRFNLFCSVGC